MDDTLIHNDEYNLFNEILNIISQQIPNPWERNLDNNKNVELYKLFYIQLNLLISDAPNSYDDFKRGIDKVIKTFSLNPAYDFLECYINDEFFFQNEKINDYSFLQDSPFNIQQIDNNIIIFQSEESPLFDPAEKSRSREYDNFYENVGNNAFQGEIKKAKPRKNAFAGGETEEYSDCIFTNQKSSKEHNLAEITQSLFHHAENNESNQENQFF